MRADMESPFVLFANMSSRFLRLRRGQIIGSMTLCGTHDFLGPSDIRHDMNPITSTPTFFFPVPKRGSPADMWSFHGSTLAAPLIDPHNRNPPVCAIDI